MASKEKKALSAKPKKSFWSIEAPPWSAPPFEIHPETRRTDARAPVRWSVQARTWQPRPAHSNQPEFQGDAAPEARPNPSLPAEPEADFEPEPQTEAKIQAGLEPAGQEEARSALVEQDFDLLAEQLALPMAFFYRRSFDTLNLGLAPYSSHPIQLGHKTYRTAAHLYWSIAFCRDPEAVTAIDALDDVPNHDEAIAHLLRIALHFRKSLQNDRLESIMFGVQLLKFCQHEALLSALLATGDAPLLYRQIPDPGQSSGQVLETLAAHLFPGTAGPSNYGEFGKPLSPTWTTLQHPDDIFWGVDPILDPAGEKGNRLGKILLDLRQRFRENRTGAFELCISVARMLAAYLKVDQHQTGPEEASFPETGNLIQVLDGLSAEAGSWQDYTMFDQDDAHYLP